MITSQIFGNSNDENLHEQLAVRNELFCCTTKLPHNVLAGAIVTGARAAGQNAGKDAQSVVCLLKENILYNL